ncbi:MAG: hypothetical protein AAF368_01410 [Planctomycetota bacterium]
MDSTPKHPGWTLPAAIALLLGGAAALLATRTDLASSGSYRLFFGLWRTRHLLLGGGLFGLGVLLLVGRVSPRCMQRLAAISIGVFVGVLGLEGLGRAGVIDWSAKLRPQAQGELSFEAIPHLDRSGTTLPDLAQAWSLPAEEIPFRYRTDQRGFRNAEDRESAEVYCVGDSFVVAGLVPFEKTLPAQLERSLGRSAMGLALSGLSPAQEIEHFLSADLDVENALVLHFLFEGNDLQDTAIAQAEPEDARPSGDSSFINEIVGWVQERTQPVEAFAALRSGRLGDRRVYFRWGGADVFPYLEESAPLLEDLTAFHSTLDAEGARYIVCLIPSKLRVLGPLCEFDEGALYADLEQHLSDFPHRVRQWGELQGVPVLDLEPALRAAAQDSELPWFEADTHWNARGVEAAVEAIQAHPAIAAWREVAR